MIFQYACCLSHDIRTDRTAHIFTHYTKTTIDELRVKMKVFSDANIDWIHKVGADYLKDVSVDTYIKDITQGTIGFDALALAIASRAFTSTLSYF